MGILLVLLVTSLLFGCGTNATKNQAANQGPQGAPGAIILKFANGQSVNSIDSNHN